MGVFVLIFSLIALFTVTGGPAKTAGFPAPMDRAYLSIPKRTFEPPARRSIIVGADGQAFRTADGTQMTKRDRAKMALSSSRVFEYKIPEAVPEAEKSITESVVVPVALPVSKPAAALEVITQAETKAVEDLSVPMMPATLPVEASDAATDPMMDQKILSSIVALDGSLSEWARVTLRCSFREGLVILYGVVKDEQEKQHIAELTKSLPEVVTVETQLHPVGAEADTAQVLTQCS